MKQLITFLSVFFLTLFLTGCDSDSGSDVDQSGADNGIFTPDTATGDGNNEILVSIKTSPSGAKIWVDGENTGAKTPESVYVTPGCHVFAVTLPGYKDWQDQACTDPNEEWLSIGVIQLEPENVLTEDFTWLEGEWVRFDDIQSGPHEAVVTVQAYPPPELEEFFQEYDCVIKGLYPASFGLPVKKISENELMINSTSGDSLTTITSTFPIGSEEIVLKKKYNDSTNQTFEYMYKRP